MTTLDCIPAFFCQVHAYLLRYPQTSPRHFIVFHGWTGYHTSTSTQGTLISASKTA